MGSGGRLGSWGSRPARKKREQGGADNRQQLDGEAANRKHRGPTSMGGGREGNKSNTGAGGCSILGQARVAGKGLS